MRKFYRSLIFLLIFCFVGCTKKSDPVGIYESDEYKTLTKKDLIIGESIWATSCFRCHRYGTNGAFVAEDKKYWITLLKKELKSSLKAFGKDTKEKWCNACKEFL